MTDPKQSYKERVIEEFDQKFFIAGKNCYGEEKGLLFPAKCEVRDFISQALDNQMKEVIDSLIDWADEKTDLQNEIIRDNFGSKDWNDGNINALHDIITHLKNLKSKELLTKAEN